MNDLTIIIDNYDSFVYNIAQLVEENGSRAVVVRNDEVSVSGIDRIRPDRIIISPGPGTPESRTDVGISIAVIRKLGYRYPIMGICLGHQIIGYTFGAKIRHARSIMHGKISKIQVIKRDRIFSGIPDEFSAARYHSLVVSEVQEPLETMAISVEDKEVMAIRHREQNIFGVQFHPESLGTAYGKTVLANFMRIKV
ncbi:MAG: aminodeoxychorismate/anthranilate synthase component II [Conexivisphaerales archaeon]